MTCIKKGSGKLYVGVTGGEPGVQESVPGVASGATDGVPGVPDGVPDGVPSLPDAVAGVHACAPGVPDNMPDDMLDNVPAVNNSVSMCLIACLLCTMARLV